MAIFRKSLQRFHAFVHVNIAPEESAAYEINGYRPKGFYTSLGLTSVSVEAAKRLVTVTVTRDGGTVDWGESKLIGLSEDSAALLLRDKAPLDEAAYAAKHEGIWFRAGRGFY